MSNRRTLAEQIESARLEMVQKENRLKELISRQKEQDRRERTHRLCRRGGLVESLLPELAVLDDNQFDIFVNKPLLSGYAAKVLRELVLPVTASVPLKNGKAEPGHPEADTGRVDVTNTSKITCNSTATSDGNN